MKRRVLCVCIGGTVRSVAVKDVLNGMYGCNALAASAIWQDDETMFMLGRWADLIVFVEPSNLPRGPNEYRHKWMSCVLWLDEFNVKRKVFDIGPDVWGNARDPELRKLIIDRVNEIL